MSAWTRRPDRAGPRAVRGSHVDFRHPLVRSVVYESATSSEQRAAHRALADALADVEEHADRRAWHLAGSSLEHDEETVRALDDAAERRPGRRAHACVRSSARRT